METLEIVRTNTKKVDKNKELSERYEQAFPVVAKFVCNRGGSFEDAKDILHDAFVIFYEPTSQNRRKVYASEIAYILGISKHLWIQRYKQEGKFASLSGMENEISVPDDYHPTVNDNKLLKFVERTGKKCLDLLYAFYYQGISLKRLVTNFGYSNEHSASVQKYKCLEKIRKTIKEKSLSYGDFVE